MIGRDSVDGAGALGAVAVLRAAVLAGDGPTAELPTRAAALVGALLDLHGPLALVELVTLLATVGEQTVRGWRPRDPHGALDELERVTLVDVDEDDVPDPARAAPMTRHPPDPPAAPSSQAAAGALVSVVVVAEFGVELAGHRLRAGARIRIPAGLATNLLTAGVVVRTEDPHAPTLAVRHL